MVVLLFLFGLLLVSTSIAVSAWVIMLLLGAFASLTGYVVFAIGFWPCVILSILFGGIGGVTFKD